MLPGIIPYPQIDPFIFRIGNFGLSWYAFFYLLGFILGYLLLRYRYRKGFLHLLRPDDVSLLVTYLFYGVVLGARIFYVLFYNFSFYWEHPWEIPAIWHGGLSFHGGFVGAVVAMWLFARRHQASLLDLMDNVGLAVPIGLGLGRIANFINGELYGRPSDVPWAMVFPQGGPEPRHPSQLYESLLEGPMLFLLMWLFARRAYPKGIVAAVGIMAYGAIRFFVELFREPDPQLGKVLGMLTMGQLMSLAMVLAGALFCLGIVKRAKRT